VLCCIVGVIATPVAHTSRPSLQNKDPSDHGRGFPALRFSSPSRLLATVAAPPATESKGFLAEKAGQLGTYMKEGWQKCSGGCKVSVFGSIRLPRFTA
jgi:hypothetical protein